MQFRRFGIVVANVLLLAGGAGAQSGEHASLWTFEADREVTSVGAINTGDLVVTTDSRSFLLAAEDGRERWSSTDLRDCRPQPAGLVCRYLDRSAQSVLFPETTYARFYFDDRLVMLDLGTGEAAFDSAAHALGKVRSHRAARRAGQLLLFSERGPNDFVVAGFRLAGGVWTVQPPITKDFQWLGEPTDDLALVYGKNAAGQRVLAAIDLQAGGLSWSHTDLLTKDVPRPAGRAPFPFADDDGNLLVFVSRDGPMRLSPTGELLWRATELAGKDPEALIQAGNVVVVSQDRKLFGLDPGTGKVLWRHDPGSPLYGFESHAKGVLVWSQKNELNLLDLSTGAPRWPKPAAIPKGWSPAWWSLIEPYRSNAQAGILEDEQAWVAGRTELVRVDMADGRVTTVALFEFGDGEAPASVDRAGGDLLLMSSQNIARIAPDGSVRFHRYHRAPGVGALARLGQLAVSGMASEGRGFNAGSGRINSSRVTDSFFYMYFEDQDGDEAHRFGLVRIDKMTGAEAPPLWINDRRPEWVLAGDGSIVVYKTGNTALRAVRY